MDAFLQQLRYAARRLRKNPAFTAVVVLTLALGIGANSAIFSVINTVLLRPFPYRDPGQLVTIDHFYPSLNNLEAGASALGYRDLRDKGTIFDGVYVQQGWAPALTEMGEARRLTGARVSGQFHRTLGVSPVLGRALREDEDAPGNHRVAVIAHGLWQREFGGDPAVLGRVIQLGNEPYEIVGVMPPSFHDFFNRRVEIWAPLALAPEAFSDDRRTNEFLALIARLEPGIDAARAQREMTAFAEQLKVDYPGAYGRTWTLKVETLTEKSAGSIRPALLVLLGAVGFVLLIACANVANLMLARAAARQKEVAIRSALGASRRALVGQLLTESLLLALIGGALGLAVAWGGVRAVVALQPANVPRVEQLAIDGSVLLFTFVVAIATGLLFGLVPALRASRANLQDTLKEGGRSSATDRGGHLLRRSLVVAEMALALTLLTGAGLLVRSFSRLAQVEPGFNTERLLTFNLALPRAKYQTDTARVAFWTRLLDRLGTVPGVQAVAGTSVMPFGGSWSTGSFAVEGYQPPQGQPGPWGDIRVVSSNFHETMGIRLIRGRPFSDRDDVAAPVVVVVDDEMVRRFWPNDDPIGKRITFGNAQDSTVQWYTVVGVVAHTKHEGLDAESRVQLYFTLGQSTAIGFGGTGLALAVRTTGDPLQALPALRQAIQELDRDIPIAGIASMEQNIANSMGQRRFAMLLLGIFAALALTLASIGIYGVMSYAVTQRSHELGVRMTLGATRRDVLTLVMRSGMGLVLLGAGIGAVGAFAMRRVIEGQLFSVSASDPVTFGVVVVTLVSVAALATLVPALRATRVDPVVVIREE
ncbi:MAG TPA: ABC transporter permease [Gemmatimonadaceae bacterium]|nr:ABC transporter permease [Gemmatimonadaceae bacterium]